MTKHRNIPAPHIPFETCQNTYAIYLQSTDQRFLVSDFFYFFGGEGGGGGVGGGEIWDHYTNLTKKRFFP